jgi:hypothetical protein
VSEAAQFCTIAEELDAGLADVWNIISDFGGLKRWSAAIESCVADGQGVGALRRVHMGGAEIVERLEAFDASAHFLQYRPISGSVMPVDDLVVTMALTSLGERRTRLEWSVFGRPTIDPAKAHASLQKRYSFRISELKEALQSG